METGRLLKEGATKRMLRLLEAAAPLATTVLLMLGSFQTAFAQQATAKRAVHEGPTADFPSLFHLGGPTSVGAQVKADQVPKMTPYQYEGLSRSLQPYYDFKARVRKSNGLAFGGDYNLLYQGASESPGEDHAAGGVVRVYGTWTLLGRGSTDTGALTFKVENRHRLGSDIAPQDLAGEIGYAGLTATPFSDAGSLLTNFYWQQSFRQNRAAFIAGIVDVTDYLDVYGFVNPWTDFINLAFSTNPTIPAPNQGLGAAVRWSFTDHHYVLAGLADANGDPGNPADSFDSFFGDTEYFKHIELGWVGDWENRFTDNIHVTAWQVDERKAAQIDEGWGLSFSYSRKIDDRWLPFIRAGYADGGGALLDRSVSAGFGYFRKDKSDVFGIGVSWGRPVEEIFGPGLDDQYTAEVFYRLQLTPHITITPDIQLLVNPAQNPEESSTWIAGLRARLAF